MEFDTCLVREMLMLSPNGPSLLSLRRQMATLAASRVNTSHFHLVLCVSEHFIQLLLSSLVSVYMIGARSFIFINLNSYLVSTVIVDSLPHRKWKKN